MQCKKMEHLIAAHANRECSPEEVEQVTSHLASCDTCRKMLLEYQKLTTAAQSITPPPLTDEVINPFYRDTLQKVQRLDQPIITLKRRLAFKPALGFALLILLVLSMGIIRQSWKPVPELVIHENMTLSEIQKLESQFCNPRIRSKWVDQPIPVTRWVGLLTELQRFERRHGSVAPRLEETLERIVMEMNPAPEKGIPISFKMGAFTLNQSIEQINRIRKYQSEITLRELAALYAQVRRT